MDIQYISRFDKSTAPGGHNDTILAGRVLPEGIRAPFSQSWGFLEGAATMEGHSHPTDQIYFVIKGKGFCHIGDKRFSVECGDVVLIPPDAFHTMECVDGEILQWAALWWKHID